MQFFLIFAGIFLGLTYAAIIFLVVKNWDKTPERSIPKTWEPTVFVSVIVPGRNEAENIISCIQSILAQSYPSDLFEIIFIDDHSDDETFDLVEKLDSENIFALKNTDSFGKKNALDFGIKKSKGSIIVTTDADCLVGKNWLRNFAFYFEKYDAEFVAAPVNFHKEKSTFERFQSLDFIGMMAVTAAGILTKKLSLANGANLAYRKKSFEKLGGFEGIDQIASGDDMLLLEKFQSGFPEGIFFLKTREATVFTKAKKNLPEFISQRLRWAGKTAHYKNPMTQVVQTLVGAFSLFIFFSLLTIPFLGIFGVQLFFGSFLFKAVIDYFFLKQMTSFFERKDLMRSFLAAQIWHIAYIVLVGGGSLFWKKTKWKGRQV